MKIQKIQINNYLGARNVDVLLSKPVSLFAGLNYAGKSSLSDAVRHALTGESTRVLLKKEFQDLVSEGQESGFVEIFGVDEGEEFTSSVVLPSGKGQHSTDTALPFVLSAQRFSGLPENEKRSFLFSLMNISMNVATIKSRLIHKGCDEAKVELIAPMLRAGFESSCKEAQTKGRECKANWKQITGGETYGSQKAASFRVEKQEVVTGNLENEKLKVVQLDAELEKLNQQLGGLQGAARQAQEQNAKLEGLRTKAAMYARARDKLTRDEASLKEWELKVLTLLNSMKSQSAVACPDCGVMLLLNDGELVHAAPLAKGTEDDLLKLPEYEKALAILQNTVANDKRDLAAADVAAKTLKELEANAHELPSSGEIDKLKADIDKLKHDRANQAAGIRMIEDAQREAKAADEKTAKAMALHHDVQAWENIADALAPDGIPGEMLAEALAPINECLAVSSETTEWPQAFIGSDMSIGIHGSRDYSLLSESEKWRVDAMIAEAVSYISGVRMLVLDRVDCLDIKGREDLLYWVSELAAAGEIETALLFATLKALPAKLPEEVEGFWIENGICSQLKEAA